MLAQHPDVGYGDEAFSPYMPRLRGNKILPSIDRVVTDSARRSGGNVHVLEVKHLPAQNLGLYPALHVADWIQTFRDMGYQSHILLHRRNGLRRMVSHIRAAKNGIYAKSIQSQDHQPLPRVSLPLEGIRHGFEVRSLLEWLHEYERGWKQMQFLFQQCATENSDFRWLSLTYEDDLEQSPVDGYWRVSEFLGLSKFKPNLCYRKVNSGSLPKLIANWDEIYNLLNSTCFSWMLELED